jgi:hypothetical protein
MTVLGKILVIINLVFSLVVGALIIMVYIASTNWRAGYEKVTASLDVANKNVQAYAEEADKVRAAAANNEAQANAKLQKAAADLTAEQTAHAATKKKLEDQIASLKQHEAADEASTAEVKRRQQEVAKLEDILKETNKQMEEIARDKAKLREEKVAAEIVANDLRGRNTGLLTQVEDLSKQLLKIKANGGTAVAATSGSRNPPPENVEGLVRSIDPVSGMMTLTIGSDAGLSEGNTLEVFSLDPAKYKGTVRIMSVRPNEAIAKPVGKPLGAIQKGDRVASRILGS